MSSTIRTISRRKELAVRAALGAGCWNIIVRWAVRVTAAGIVGGLAGAVAMTRLMRALLFGIDPLDPVTYAIVISLFAVVALTAGVLPAWRAARVDPAIALNAE